MRYDLLYVNGVYKTVGTRLSVKTDAMKVTYELKKTKSYQQTPKTPIIKQLKVKPRESLLKKELPAVKLIFVRKFICH